MRKWQIPDSQLRDGSGGGGGGGGQGGGGGHGGLGAPAGGSVSFPHGHSKDNPLNDGSQSLQLPIDKRTARRQRHTTLQGDQAGGEEDTSLQPV